MNRGSEMAIVIPSLAEIASMRPRFMNRGSSKARREAARAKDASMRPRFMNRGSDCRSFAATDPGTGFNEAPIHESGKWRRFSL